LGAWPGSRGVGAGSVPPWTRTAPVWPCLVPASAGQASATAGRDSLESPTGAVGRRPRRRATAAHGFTELLLGFRQERDRRIAEDGGTRWCLGGARSPAAGATPKPTITRLRHGDFLRRGLLALAPHYAGRGGRRPPQARPRLLGHDTRRFLLESARDHDPAALRERLAGMLSLVRQTITVKNDASCSRRPDTATRNMARATPLSV
jgi:hypothetical protein